MVLLEVFVSQAQGQNSTAVSPSATFSSVVSQSSIATTPNGSSTTEPTIGTSEKPTTSFEKIYTCAKLRVTINSTWEEDYGNKSSNKYKALFKVLSSALQKLYNTTHKDVKVSDVTFKSKTGKLFLEAKLCLVFEMGKDSIKDVFFDKVKTGKLPGDVPVVKDSAEFEASKVEYKNYEAKEGECDKCDGAGGPFEIVGNECVPNKGFSCNGLEKTNTKETDDCATYCSSTVALTVSSLILAIGILLSSSFQ